jgi:hypothetical protein
MDGDAKHPVGIGMMLIARTEKSNPRAALHENGITPCERFRSGAFFQQRRSLRPNYSLKFSGKSSIIPLAERTGSSTSSLVKIRIAARTAWVFVHPHASAHYSSLLKSASSK